MADTGLRLELLGSPVVEAGGLPLAVDTRKAVALLAFLAVEGGTHRRDTLANLLWPDVEQDRGRAALRRTLSTLKHALGGDHLVVTRESVVLDMSGVRLDVDRFHELAATGGLAGLAEAADLYRDSFMAGFGLRDSVVFDDWQSLQDGRLQRELGGVLERLSAELVEAGEVRRALEHARNWLALDPLHEPAHRRLIELYAAGGERRAALDQYRQCVRVLHRELGVAPLETTTELYQAVREGAGPTPATQPPLPAGTGPRPFVGREREWAALTKAYRAVQDDGRVVVLEGELGIGKTRLGAQLLDWVRGQGGLAIGVRSFEHESGLAYGTLIELLRASLRAGRPEHVSALARSEAGRLVPGLGPPGTPAEESPGAQARLYDGLVAALDEATRGARPAVLLIDDLHWADSASLEVLAYLARRLRGRPLLLTLAWRSEETPPDHAARRVLGEAQRDGLASTIALRPLARADVERLVEAAGRPAEIVERLHRESQGVPLFVTEYLDAATDDWSLPTGVRGLLEARLDSASGVAAQVVAAGAVLGRPFDVETVRVIAGRGDEEVVAALDELCPRGILVEEDELYDFRHEQVRAVAYERLSVGRRRLLHGRAADALAARASAAGSAGLVGQHLRRAGRLPEAAEWYLLAGEQARSLHANAEALAHLEEARSLGHPDTTRLESAIGDLLTLQGRYGDALSAYEAAAAFATDDERAAVEHRIGLVHVRRGEWELADDSFAEAAASAPAEQLDLRSRIDADRSLAAHRRGADDEARELAGGALSRATEAGDDRAAAQAHNILGMLAAGGPDRAAARRHLDSSLALAEGVSDDVARIAALNNLALLDRTEGLVEPALRRTEEARLLCAKVGDRHREAALANNAADLLHVAGRHNEALALVKEAVAIFAEVGDEGALEPEIWKLREW